MNFKQTASIGILVFGIGFFGLKSADAKIPSAQQPTVSNSSTDIKPSQSSSYTVAQTFEPSPIYATWKLTHSIDGMVYESTLVMNGRSGVMRTRFFNSRLGKTEVVKQNMKLTTSPSGLILVGSNPVYNGTSTRYKDWSEDNFILSITPEGPVVVTCDRLMRCSNVELEVIK